MDKYRETYMKECWVASFGDTHGGSKFSLLMPETQLHEETPDGEIVAYRPKLTKTQEFLLKLYDEQRQAVADLADGLPIVVIHGGDLCQGQRHPTQLMSTRLSDQVFIGADVLRAWKDVPNLVAMRMVMGTEAHNEGEGSLELLAVKQVETELPIEIASHYRFTIADVIFDVAHHGAGPSSRYWLNSNSLRWYIEDVVMRDIMELGVAPPDIVLRFHFHTFVAATHDYIYHRQPRKVFGYIHPAWCGMNPYAQKATRSKATTHYGMLAFHIKDGTVAEVVDRMVVWVDRRTKETLDVC